MSYQLKSIISFLHANEIAANKAEDARVVREGKTKEKVTPAKKTHRFIGVVYDFGNVPKEYQHLCRKAKRDLDIKMKIPRDDAPPKDVFEKFLETVDVVSATNKPKETEFDQHFKRCWKVKITDATCQQIARAAFKDVTGWEVEKADRSRLSEDEKRSREITRKRAKGTATLQDLLWQQSYMKEQTIAAAKEQGMSDEEIAAIFA